jgi:hypothetical protein
MEGGVGRKLAGELEGSWKGVGTACGIWKKHTSLVRVPNVLAFQIPCGDGRPGSTTRRATQTWAFLRWRSPVPSQSAPRNCHLRMVVNQLQESSVRFAMMEPV